MSAREPWFSRFLPELRRRHVLQVGGTYLLTSWGIIQVSTTVFPLLDIPAKAGTIIFFLLLAGLPLVIFFAWTYDITAEGIRRTDGDALVRSIRFRPRLLLAFVIPVVSFGLWTALARHQIAESLDAHKVAVFPFEVSAPDAFANMNEGVAQMIADKLSGEGGLRAVSPLSAIKAWNHAARRSELDERDAVGLARDLGAGHVLLGSVVGAGNNIVITTKLYDAVTHIERVRGEVTGPTDSLISLVDRLVIQLLSRQAGESEESVPSLTTASLPALKLYLEGQSAYRNSEFERAQDLFEQALVVDTTFALAGLAHARAQLWTDGAQRIGLARAEAHRNELGARHRMMLDAFKVYAADSSAFRDIIAQWERVVVAAPDDPDAVFVLADAYFHMGPAVGIADAHGKAYRWMNRTLQLDSTYAPVFMHMLAFPEVQGNPTLLRKFANTYLRVERKNPAEPAVLANRWRIAIALNDAHMLRQWRVTVDSLGGAVRIPLAFVLYGGLPVDDLERTLELSVNNALDDRARATALAEYATFLLQTGRPQAGTQAFLEAEQLTPNKLAAIRHILNAGLRGNGDRQAAHEAHIRGHTIFETARAGINKRAIYQTHCALGEWEAATADTAHIGDHLDAITQGSAARDSVGPWNVGSCALRIAAQVAELRAPGSPNRPLQILDSLLAIGAISNDGNFQAGNITSMRLHEQRGEYEAALASARRRVFDMNPSAVSTQFLGQARLAERLGLREEAIEAYRLFLNLRTKAEPGTQADLDARAARTALAKLTSR